MFQLLKSLEHVERVHRTSVACIPVCPDNGPGVGWDAELHWGSARVLGGWVLGCWSGKWYGGIWFWGEGVGRCGGGMRRKGSRLLGVLWCCMVWARGAIGWGGYVGVLASSGSGSGGVLRLGYQWFGVLALHLDPGSVTQ